jgi:hypothetical protein
MKSNTQRLAPKRMMFVGMMFWVGATLFAFDTFDSITTSNRRATTKEPLFGGKCPALVEKKKGVYSDLVKRDGFQDTVIITASNHQFITYYENWKLIAEGHGLQHVLMSMDQATHDKIGDDQSILLPSNHRVESAGGFRTASYNTLVCNKIRMVLEILDNCNVNVVFSDADNVMIKDPFQHDLGEMIKSDKIDYIYQTNSGWTKNAREHQCTNNGQLGAMEGNTGFHFMKPTAPMKQLLQDTLDDCDAEGNEIDDQSLLWAHLRSGLRNGTNWEHCPSYAGVNGTAFEQLAGNETKARICCLDPHYYPTGQREPENKKEIVSLHANFWPSSAAGKIDKLHSFSDGLGWRLPRNIEDHKAEAAKIKG